MDNSLAQAQVCKQCFGKRRHTNARMQSLFERSVTSQNAFKRAIAFRGYAAFCDCHCFDWHPRPSFCHSESGGRATSTELFAAVVSFGRRKASTNSKTMTSANFRTKPSYFLPPSTRANNLSAPRSYTHASPSFLARFPSFTWIEPCKCDVGNIFILSTLTYLQFHFSHLITTLRCGLFL